jgi:DNA polymerase elongation subunit (family B)
MLPTAILRRPSREECRVLRSPIASSRLRERHWKGYCIDMVRLTKAIEFIHSRHDWKAEVVYGDTDSLFVYLPGRTRENAFDIGEDIATTITRMNPHPVKLKFEKVTSK